MAKLYRLSWVCRNPLCFGQTHKFTTDVVIAPLIVAEIMNGDPMFLLIEDAAEAAQAELDAAEQETLQIDVPAHLAKFCGG